MRFEPKRVTIHRGEWVQWHNVSTQSQTVTDDPELVENLRSIILPHTAPAFHSGPLQPGEAFEHQFDVPGFYRYCSIPFEAEEMTGEVVVEEAGSDISSKPGR
jgi:plastocyanin